MSDDIYLPLIEDITWSYSNLETFNDCKYRWFLRYIKHMKQDDMFYASYGLYMHELIERYYNNELTSEELPIEFLINFSERVRGTRPKESIVNSYMEKGLEYFKVISPFPYKKISVEQEINFEMFGMKFVCRVDYIGQDDDGNLVIVDNKSRDLKPRSKRKNPTVKDKELDEMLKQLYVYSYAVESEYGKKPKFLCFNCFKSGEFIVEEFDENKYNETLEWVKKTINKIKECDDFYPNIQFFPCKYICGFGDKCCYNIMMRDSNTGRGN